MRNHSNGRSLMAMLLALTMTVNQTGVLQLAAEEVPSEIFQVEKAEEEYAEEHANQCDGIEPHHTVPFRGIRLVKREYPYGLETSPYEDVDQVKHSMIH